MLACLVPWEATEVYRMLVLRIPIFFPTVIMSVACAEKMRVPSKDAISEERCAAVTMSAVCAEGTSVP